MVSNADESSWQYVSCDKCEGTFDNEMDLLHHKERVHGYGEDCQLYPCEECGFRSSDNLSLKKHVEDMHPKNLYQKRRKHNLIDVDIDKDSEDEYVPGEEDEALLIEESDDFPPKKRKKNIQNLQLPQKKIKIQFDCKKCLKSFSRKDSLSRHMKNYCKPK